MVLASLGRGYQGREKGSGFIRRRLDLVIGLGKYEDALAKMGIWFHRIRWEYVLVRIIREYGLTRLLLIFS